MNGGQPAFFYPLLTVISQHVGAIGGAAAMAVIAALEKPGTTPDQSLWAGELVKRASTALPNPQARAGRRGESSN